MSRQRQALVLLAAAVAVCQIVVAVLVAGNKCGDDCDVSPGEPARPGVQWWQDENAWQWTGQAVLAAIDFVVVLTACGLYVRGREREARIATPIGGVLFALWALAVQPALTL